MCMSQLITVSADGRIRARVASVLGEAVEFNEILSVMYREGQKMSWHDDGEHGMPGRGNADTKAWDQLSRRSRSERQPQCRSGPSLSPRCTVVTVSHRIVA